jgi:hypothetical protein
MRQQVKDVHCTRDGGPLQAQEINDGGIEGQYSSVNQLQRRNGSEKLGHRGRVEARDDSVGYFPGATGVPIGPREQL